MKLFYKLTILSIMVLMFFPNNSECFWPFNRDNDYNGKEIIQKYRQFEKKNDFSDEMIETIQKAVKGKGKNDFTLRMAYMRLKYYKAVQDRDQSSIQKVSNEAESLLKGDHPHFRQYIRENKVQEFLSALKDSRYNEKRSRNWKVLIIFIVVCIVAFAGGISAISNGSTGGAILGGIIGLLIGIVVYYVFGNYLFYKVSIDYSILPSVPILG